MINKSEITGIILAGGKSSRMGKDKGLCEFNGKTLVEHAIETLKPLCGQLIISSNRFHEKYRSYNLPVVSDEIKNTGPIGGIYTCLKLSKTRHNIILSCDTPFVGSLLLQHIINNVEKEQIVAPAHHKFLIEPLSAYYATNVLNDVEDSIRKGDYKLINLLKKVRFKSVQINKFLSFYNEHSFLNINCPDDMTQAEEIVKKNEFKIREKE